MALDEESEGGLGSLVKRMLGLGGGADAAPGPAAPQRARARSAPPRAKPRLPRGSEDEEEGEGGWQLAARALGGGGDGVETEDKEGLAAFYMAGRAAPPPADADTFATVGGHTLPLHSGVLAACCGAVRQLREDAQRHGGQLDLTPCFDGASLTAAACFLRLAYCPSSPLAPLARQGVLPGVAWLAARLEAPRLLQRIQAHWADATQQTSTTELVGALRGAQALGWAQVEARSLALLADRLAVAGRWSRDVVGDDALEGLGAPALVQLLRCMLTRCDGALYARPLVSQVELAPPRSGSFVLTVGGWAAAAAADGGAITSRWVALGRGLEWRVSVHPGGAGAGRGKHLSADLTLNSAAAAQAGAAAVTAAWSVQALDQAGEACNDVERPRGAGAGPAPRRRRDVFKPEAGADTWCQPEVLPLAVLAAGGQDRHLLHDRLVLRVAVEVSSVERA